jgi:hypothetical protein
VTRDRDDEPMTEGDGGEPTAEERAQARSLARLVDGLVAGAIPPPALPADDRALLETATMIRAGLTEQRLDPARREKLFERLPPATSGWVGSYHTPLTSWRRRAPWIVAAVAAAAAVILALKPPVEQPARHADGPVDLPLTQQSRPADPLIGEIPRAASGDASARMDVIYADRLAGYRSVLLQREAVSGRGRQR